MDITEYLMANGWTIVREALTPGQPPVFAPYTDLPLSSLARRILSSYPNGLYGHQHCAIGTALEGQDICMTTATSSGKSLVFYVCGTEMLQRKPTGTVLAIYPLKALTDEQEAKWVDAMEQTGTRIRVGRIDGSVPMPQRKQLIRQSSIMVMTPDVVHAWLLSNLGEAGVRNFVANLQLIVVDEAHTYTGVFGSNAAYLLRRVLHAASRLGAFPRFIAASATINNPIKHLRQLTGREFRVIDQASDTAGCMARRLLMVEAPREKDELKNLTDLMSFIASETDHQFITFVDSRKQTEQLASMMRRNFESEEDETTFDYNQLQRLHVHPYRAGYEAKDRKIIQDRLRHGKVRGVISTSALEMGMDLPLLTLGILYGIPTSATSYFQRVGRVGRHADGTIIVVNNGSIRSNRIFRNPSSLDFMPLAESALYLENPRIQYIHAMCLARPHGEDDAISPSEDARDELQVCTDFPERFVALCNRERNGEVNSEFQMMKLQSGDDPNHVFPLRDCDIQYTVETAWSEEPRRLGSLSFGQVMREAYPGAVYYYQTEPFRVIRILFRDHKIIVRQEKKHYTTKPTCIPTLIFPNLSEGNVYGAQSYGEMRLLDCNLQVQETIVGFKERRGPNEFSQSYPLDPDLGLFFDLPRFQRNYFSSGVLFLHPDLGRSDVNREMLVELLLEAFVMEVPFERQDLGCGSDRIRVARGGVAEGQRFLCVYDQTYGSLRLTSRLFESNVLRGVLEKALDIAQNDDAFEVRDATLEALLALYKCSREEPTSEPILSEPEFPLENCTRVILPSSVGIYPDYENEEFRVEAVFFTPRGLVYRGRRLSKQGKQCEKVDFFVPVDKIVPVEGLSMCGFYNYDTGEVEAGAEDYGHSVDDPPSLAVVP